MPSLPQHLQNALSLLPDLVDKFGYVVYDASGRVVLCSDSLRPLLSPGRDGGTDIRDLFSDQLNYRSDGFDLFPASAANVVLSLRPPPEDMAHPISKFSEFFYGIPASLVIRPVDAWFVAFVHPMIYFMERSIGRITPDMLAILAEDEEILLYCYQLKPLLTREKGKKLRMDQFTDPAPWRRLMDRDRTAADYLEDLQRRSIVRPWSSPAVPHPMDSARWISDAFSVWKAESGVFMADSPDRNAFFVCLESLDQALSDLRMEFDVETEGLVTAGACFGLNIYNAQADTLLPDFEGYNFQMTRSGIRGTASPRPSMFEVRLKRSGEIIGIQLIDTAAFPPVPGRPAGVMSLSFERSNGGCFSMSINGLPAAAFRDLVPLNRPQNNYFCLLGGGRVRIRNFAILFRPTLFEPNRLPPDAVDLSFYRLPGRIFQARVTRHPFEMGYNRNLRYVYMKDVTESRELTNRLNTYIHGIDEELSTARRIQNHMATLKLPDNGNIRFSYLFRPSGKVSGDMLDIREIEENKYALLIYDVAGHGIAASLISAMARMSFDNAFKHTVSPSLIMEEVNADICKLSDPAMFLTAFLCIIDLEKRAMTYSRAGHCIPALFSRERPAPFLLDKGCPIIGNSPDLDCPQFHASIRENDRLLIYTDGLIEVRDRESRLFSKERLFSLVRDTLDMPLEAVQALILKQVTAFKGDDQFDDDMAMILADIRRTGAGLSEVQV